MNFLENMKKATIFIARDLIKHIKAKLSLPLKDIKTICLLYQER